MKFSHLHSLKQFFQILFFSLAIVGSAQAAISVSEDPLFLNVAVDPNIVVTLDDSGSMRWAVVPDALIDTSLDTKRRLRSATFNALYYNPSVTYLPPKNASGVSYPNSSFNAAWINGLDPAKGTVNLSKNYMAPLYHDPSVSTTYSGRTGGYDLVLNSPAGTGTDFAFTSGTTIPYFGRWNGGGWSVYTRGVAAYYYNYVPGNPSCTAGDYNDEDCYTYVKVPNTQETNFANWYSYYRNRVLATASGALLAFNDFPTNVRLAWQSLGTCKSFGGACTDKNGASYDNKIRQFDGAHRTNFLTWLTKYPASLGYTPLRDAMHYAGTYYTTTGITSPYAENPQVTAGSSELSCRKNYHIMFTDGVWNGDTLMSGSALPGNADNTAISLPDGSSYNPADTTSRIYKDSNSNNVSDLAFKFWSKDLRSDLINNVVPRTIDRSGTASQQYWNPKNNPSTWQNMVNYTVGLGMTGTLLDPDWAGSTYAGDYTALAAGTKSWPVTGDYLSPGNVYDLWHAAINSRGEFFSVESPNELVTALKQVVTSILEATPSAAALAANSTSIKTGSLVYQARFDSKDWSGDLIAYPVQEDGSIGSALWQAKTLMPSPASRVIYTINGSSGIAFTNCATLTSDQKTALDKNAAGVTDSQCSNRLSWLRGNTITGMRSRPSTILGDIINSDPIYVHAEDYGYATAAFVGAGSYATYVTGKGSRIPMVYVGGNDGMLHAFRGDIGATDSGAEKFAFIPNAVFANLSKLTDTSYVHKYFVDGSPTVGDAYVGGGWKTFLVSGLGAGGKSVFALDISNPASPSPGMVKWEFTDVDMGYSFSKPQIARLPDGSWVAIFGNGYNSSSERAYLYVVDINTGALIQKIAAGTATANGLSTPVLHDSDNDKIVDTAYAGDLQGNLWKFDLSAGVAASWVVANAGSPLFSARNDAGEVQAITAQPTLGGNPAGGIMVYVGTGIYLGASDLLDAKEQSFYGIWDNGTAILTTDRSELQEQSILAETTEFSTDVRETTSTIVSYPAKRGWYMDFDVPSPAGERVVTQALLRYGRVIFLTLIPSTAACEPGGSSWLMELDALTGAAMSGSNFDFNNDGLFDDADKLASGGTAAGIKTSVGITKPPAWFSAAPSSVPGGTPAVDYKIMTGTTGGIQSTKNKGDSTSEEPPGGGVGGGGADRVYWRQIQ